MTVLARRSSLLLVFAVACFAIALAVVSAQQASAAAYRTCHGVKNHAVGKYGTGLYLKTLKIKGDVTCAGAKNFVKLYYNCRTKGSKPIDGRCNTKVNDYTCGTEHRSNPSSISFDGKVTCWKGSKRIQQTYVQQTAAG